MSAMFMEGKYHPWQLGGWAARVEVGLQFWVQFAKAAHDGLSRVYFVVHFEADIVEYIL
jgi:hypothetical protein